MIKPLEENFSCRLTTSGSSLAEAGLQAAQRFRRMRLPFMFWVSRFCPVAKSVNVMAGGRMRGLSEDPQDMKSQGMLRISKKRHA